MKTRTHGKPKVENLPPLMIAAHYKLDEADFFLSKLQEITMDPQIDASGRQFGWYLSAFLSAARSPLQILANVNEKAFWIWVDREIKKLTREEQAIYKTLSKFRNLSVHHEGKAEADSTIKFVPEWELSYRPRSPFQGFVFSPQLPGIPSPKIGIRKFTIKIDGKVKPALECCSKYRQIVGQLVEDYRVVSTKCTP